MLILGLIKKNAYNKKALHTLQAWILQIIIFIMLTPKLTVIMEQYSGYCVFLSPLSLS
jgi:hypothetical protein